MTPRRTYDESDTAQDSRAVSASARREPSRKSGRLPEDVGSTCGRRERVGRSQDLRTSLSRDQAASAQTPRTLTSRDNGEQPPQDGIHAHDRPHVRTRNARERARASRQREHTEQELDAQRHANQQPRKGGRLKIVLIVVALFVVVVGALFAWDRWFHYNDAADFQGTWKVKSTGQVVSIDSTHMDLGENADFSYTLNPESKTVLYTLGNLSGWGGYYFSRDRDTLVITDGGNAGILEQLGFVADPAVLTDDASDTKTVLVRQ